ncbi:DeoR/GlpR family DNA-binding transcription regulator [Wukongibacter baidiensis]|uniref:DeoR/GlpR family DNA-binding transcription regulator n=1 Tax=Wukongibacter baidiensis TaxID=1723361 RepID=UPI003D7F99F4
MLPITRKKKITNIIKEKKSVTVTELSKEFNVSEETIRRDLAQLEKDGVLNRVYGGAYIVDGVQNDVDINLRKNIYSESKEKIANICSGLIENGDSIILDSSTTCLYIAKKVIDKNITVITNSLQIANALEEASNIKLIMIGGSFDAKTLAFYGRNAELFAGKYFADKVFVSCRALNLEKGIMDSNEHVAEMRRVFLNQGCEVNLVADFSKFDRIAFIHFADFEEVNAIITDKKLGDEWHSSMDERGIKIFDEELSDDEYND